MIRILISERNKRLLGMLSPALRSEVVCSSPSMNEIEKVNVLS